MATFQLKKTCHACPEQYDVFHKEKYVGYLRLRHGIFRCDDANGNIIYYNADISGPGGTFDSEEDRSRELNKALMVLRETLSVEPFYEITEE